MDALGSLRDRLEPEMVALPVELTRRWCRRTGAAATERIRLTGEHAVRYRFDGTGGAVAVDVRLPATDLERAEPGPGAGRSSTRSAGGDASSTGRLATLADAPAGPTGVVRTVDRAVAAVLAPGPGGEPSVRFDPAAWRRVSDRAGAGGVGSGSGSGARRYETFRRAFPAPRRPPTAVDPALAGPGDELHNPVTGETGHLVGCSLSGSVLNGDLDRSPRADRRVSDDRGPAEDGLVAWIHYGYGTVTGEPVGGLARRFEKRSHREGPTVLDGRGVPEDRRPEDCLGVPGPVSGTGSGSERGRPPRGPPTAGTGSPASRRGRRSDRTG